jgi:alkyldihydroxyacetonephosphate synthase
MVEAVESALRNGLENTGEKVYVFTHLSHLYPHGSAIYTTYLFRIAQDPDETLQRWQTLKTAASRAILANKGTISHQHGVGTDHLPYLSEEKGALGMRTIRDICRQFDPKGIMNPGKLFSGEST